LKKWLIVIGVMVLFLGIFVFYNKLYYPSLPMENISEKEVIEKLNDSHKQIVNLSNENDYEWYIISERNMASADEIIKALVIKKWLEVQVKGW
jgi:cell fate regulator YaaT (PSP1 superfamily)